MVALSLIRLTVVPAAPTLTRRSVDLAVAVGSTSIEDVADKLAVVDVASIDNVPPLLMVVVPV